MKNKNLLQQTIAATAMTLSLLGLAGCSSSSVSSSGETAYITKGTASKGIIQNGVVTIFEVDANGNPIRQVGEAITDSQGQYQATLNSDYSGGVLLVKVEAGTGSTMICDVYDGGCEFGKPVPLEAGFEMEAFALPPEAGRSIRAPVSPLSMMVVERARALGNIDKANVAKAAAEASELVGVDVLSIAPVDITKGLTGVPEENKVLTVFLAGIGKITLAQGNKELESGLKRLARSFKDGKFTPDDEIQISSVLEAVRDQATRAKVNSTRLTSRLSIIQAALDANDGVFDPEPGTGSSGTDVAKAKGLLKELRSWVASVEALEDPAKIWQNELKTTQNLLDSDVDVLLATYANVAEAVGAELSTRIGTSTSPQNFTVSLGTGTSMAVQGAPGNNGGVVYHVSNAQGLNGITQLTMNIETSLSETELKKLAAKDSVTLDTLKLKLSGEIANAKARLSVDDMTIDARLASAYTIDPAATTPPPTPAFTSALFNAELEIESIEKGVTFSGKASIQSIQVQVQDGTTNVLGLKNFTLNGNISATDGQSFATTLELSLDNPARANLLEDNTETDAAFATGTLSWTTRLKLADRPDATLNVTARRIGRYLAEGIATLGYDNRTISINGQFLAQDSNSSANGAVRFTNNQGVEISFDAATAKRKGTIKVGGRLVGFIESTEEDGRGNVLIARFEDGSFESLY